MVKEVYQAAFIVPVGAVKTLSEDGWMFESSNRLSSAIKDDLIESLRLSFQESYLGIESYVGGNMKMSVHFDDQNKIESIHFQPHNDALSSLSKVYKAGTMSARAELFIPQSVHGARS